MRRYGWLVVGVVGASLAFWDFFGSIKDDRRALFEQAVAEMREQGYEPYLEGGLPTFRRADRKELAPNDNAADALAQVATEARTYAVRKAEIPKPVIESWKPAVLDALRKAHYRPPLSERGAQFAALTAVLATSGVTEVDGAVRLYAGMDAARDTNFRALFLCVIASNMMRLSDITSDDDVRRWLATLPKEHELPTPTDAADCIWYRFVANAHAYLETGTTPEFHEPTVLTQTKLENVLSMREGFQEFREASALSIRSFRWEMNRTKNPMIRDLMKRSLAPRQELRNVRAMLERRLNPDGLLPMQLETGKRFTNDEWAIWTQSRRTSGRLPTHLAHVVQNYGDSK